MSSVRLLLALLLLGASPALAEPAAPPPRGQLLLIGGGGEPDVFWTKFLDFAGGPAAPIVVLPTASERPEAGPEYVTELVEKWHATSVRWLPIYTREDAARPDHVAALRAARGIFFTGGDQSRITAAFLGSPALAALRAAWEGGAVIAGTSAGTACMSAVMITGEGDFGVVRGGGAVETAAGLGFVTEGVMDQHFVTRQRFNRLLSVVLEHPDLLGLGVDEKTVAWIDPDRRLEVLGDGSVLVIDAAASTGRSIEEEKPRLGAIGVSLHVLLPGDRLDLRTRRVLPFR